MARYSRLIYEECMKWVNLRKAFGKPLSEQAVIRAKLGAMLANVDAGQAYLERELASVHRVIGDFMLMCIDSKT
jgi:alkylation response protein AidB-like acyl-CoA dehydrogenase